MHTAHNLMGKNIEKCLKFLIYPLLEIYVNFCSITSTSLIHIMCIKAWESFESQRPGVEGLVGRGRFAAMIDSAKNVQYIAMSEWWTAINSGRDGFC